MEDAEQAERLERARRAVAEGETQIQRQRDLIVRFDKAGKDTTEARAARDPPSPPSGASKELGDDHSPVSAGLVRICRSVWHGSKCWHAGNPFQGTWFGPSYSGPSPHPFNQGSRRNATYAYGQNPIPSAPLGFALPHSGTMTCLWSPAC